VYPTHGAGSFCSAPGSGDRTTTIGRERATNPLLQAPGEDAFVHALLAGLGSFPTYFRRLPEVNRRGPRLYDTLPAVARLDLAAFDRARDDGALVIDARRIAAFAAGHVPDALSIELRPVFASWLGWLVEADRALVFVLDDDQDRAELVRQCLDVGCEELLGELDGGMRAWRTVGRSEARVELVDATHVARDVLDVRQQAEYDSGHVPGARHVELGSLPAAVDTLPRRPITVMCGHGERAMTGASIIAAHDRTDISVLAGGPDDWQAATGRPLE
jgi:rhodanese-related sulfurtransferase